MPTFAVSFLSIFSDSWLYPRANRDPARARETRAGRSTALRRMEARPSMLGFCRGRTGSAAPKEAISSSPAWRTSSTGSAPTPKASLPEIYRIGCPRVTVFSLEFSGVFQCNSRTRLFLEHLFEVKTLELLVNGVPKLIDF